VSGRWECGWCGLTWPATVSACTCEHGRRAERLTTALTATDLEHIREIVREEIKVAMLVMWGSRP
jgi:hypothetical protein